MFLKSGEQVHVFTIRTPFSAVAACPLYGSGAVVCQDGLRECGRFLVVEHWHDIHVHERILSCGIPTYR